MRSHRLEPLAPRRIPNLLIDHLAVARLDNLTCEFHADCWLGFAALAVHVSLQDAAFAGIRIACEHNLEKHVVVPF